MHVSEDFCRQQEALQLAKAASEPLKNRRNIALAAAAAWGVQATIASKRKSNDGPDGDLDARITLEFAREAAAAAAENRQSPEAPISGADQ